MKRPSFDVLTEPWIPVLSPDGRREELGILDCLERAHELREIRDPSPLIEFGLYRLLVAFVLDALIDSGRRPAVPADLKKLLQGGKFQKKLLKDYAAGCGDVFDLFHPERPFLQTKMPSAKAKALAGMYPVMPSGSNVGHWDHRGEDEHVVSASAAARLLTTISPFMTQGGSGLSPSINGAPGVYVLPVGCNFFETLVMNLPLRNQDKGDGSVAWKSKRAPGKEMTRATMVEALTWRPRKIRFVPNVGGSGDDIGVKAMGFEKGDSTRIASWFDPNLAYRFGKDKTMPVRMRENRPLWRDAGPLTLLDQQSHGQGEQKVAYRRPDVVEEAFKLVDAKDPVVIHAYGMRTDLKMKVFEWNKSVLVIPAKLGRSTRLGRLVQGEFERAENVSYYLRTGIKALFPREGAGNKNALGTVVDRAERAFWMGLESRFQALAAAFGELDPDAPDDPGLVAATAGAWRASIRQFALEAFETAAQDMDGDSDALERQVLARTRLHNMLRKVLS